ncbi:MAG: CTP synthase [Candidatus Korarchaeota archaeon]|nr:CTP synthase [Thermoproteota archaeon]
MKLIFITGSLSGIGKGTIAASIATILKICGFNTTIAKVDPYINLDAGLMNPHEHGEVYVLDQIWDFRPARDLSYRICEVDQDFGTYERFLHQNLHPSHNITSGQVYLSVILRERSGKYLGRTVQLIPHVTEEIKRRILEIASKHEVTIVEIGGTVGDYEASVFLEAIRQLKYELPPKAVMIVHIVWVPFLKNTGEFKTKPAQHSFRLLLESGLTCDAIVARVDENNLPLEAKRKLSLYSNVPINGVFVAPNVAIIYELIFTLMQQKIHEYIFNILGLDKRSLDTELINKWSSFIHALKSPREVVNIALVGKYTLTKDTYISILEALRHASAYYQVRPEIAIIDSEAIEREGIQHLQAYDAIILTPGFGKRGSEGMIRAAYYALRTGTPFLGICFGAQLATAAFARYIVGLERANSTEIDPETPYPVVDILPEQRSVTNLGGTMRLGGIEIKIIENTKLYELYGSNKTRERFRHRYHIVWDFVKIFANHGYIVSAIDAEGNIAAFELKDHQFYIGVQYHPEYSSRPLKPHPLFVGLIQAALKRRSRTDGSHSEQNKF